MTLDSTKDLLFLVLALATGWVAVFLCWGLYELAKMLHQANAVITETREKINRVEHAVMTIKDKLESSVGYLGMLAEGGKSIMSMFTSREAKRAKGKKTKKHSDDEE